MIGAAHIRALGEPHNGPDVPENLLSPCPNDHVLIDSVTIYIDSSNKLLNYRGQRNPGALKLRSEHKTDQNYICVHREYFAGQSRKA